jgi:hypothetical protein
MDFVPILIKCLSFTILFVNSCRVALYKLAQACIMVPSVTWVSTLNQNVTFSYTPYRLSASPHRTSVVSISQTSSLSEVLPELHAGLHDADTLVSSQHSDVVVPCLISRCPVRLHTWVFVIL